MKDYKQSKSHYNTGGLVSFSINQYNTAVNSLGLINQQDANSLIGKIRAIDEVFKELRELYSKQYSLSPTEDNRRSWNNMEQLAYLFTYKVTGFFTHANKAYESVKGKNLNDEKVQSQFKNEISTIIKIYNYLPDMKGFLSQIISQIDSANIGLQNIQNWLTNAISKSITG